MPESSPWIHSESKPDFVRRGFDSIAARYDRLNDLMTLGLHRRWKREVIRRLSLRSGMRILDICSGTGDLAIRAAQSIQPNGHVAALDFTPNMMAAGRERTQLFESAQIFSWIGGDATQLPFADESFDGASVGFGLRNVASIEAVLQEVYRVLRPGAWFVNLDTAGSEWGVIEPFYKMYMRVMVPLMGRLFAGSRDMYAYLSSSAAAFETPQELQGLLQKAGFAQTGYAYRPRIVGGAALAWARKPDPEA
ncbi:MAG: bifunctional demethylmenaquinone methyltransferase/2-methoxy-6-polyprenyl-1,4-benzoquinol methylase UbiE [Candidatus Omnitrophica bacterium]|nr:bifunctional demethylmenaquinone methyltransferase/2-methoxy-6-polyprenyl-1,4-benzoquinol methylase UbiE [Candidatus Omnitrophota bacterium]